MLDDDRRNRLHELSKLLFGQKWRLEVMITLLHVPEPFTQKQIVRSLGLDSPSYVQGTIDTLRDAGLLCEDTPTANPADSRSKPMRRVKSKAWEWVDELDQQMRPSGKLRVVPPGPEHKSDDSRYYSS